MKQKDTLRIGCMTSMASAAIHFLYFAQQHGIHVSQVLQVGSPELERFHVLEEYSRVKGFGLHFITDPNADDTASLLRSMDLDVLVIIIDTILTAKLIKIPHIGILNTHAGVLPRYRGRDCRRWAVLEDGEVGSTAHLVSPTLDQGAILSVQTTPVRPGDTIASLSERNYHHCKYQATVAAIRKLGSGGKPLGDQHDDEGRRYHWMHPKMKALVDEKLQKLSQP